MFAYRVSHEPISVSWDECPEQVLGCDSCRVRSCFFFLRKLPGHFPEEPHILHSHWQCVSDPLAVCSLLSLLFVSSAERSVVASH